VFSLQISIYFFESDPPKKNFNILQRKKNPIFSPKSISSWGGGEREGNPKNFPSHNSGGVTKRKFQACLKRHDGFHVNVASSAKISAASKKIVITQAGRPVS
jgi:hypothetical protein